MRTSTTPRRQRGIGLLDALIAFLVLSLGMLAIARVQGQMRLNAEVARQRSEAVRLAQEDMESMRAFGVLASETHTLDASAGHATNTAYRVVRQIEPAAAALPAKTARITVGWADRQGGAQQIALASVIAGNAPAYSGALGLSRPGTTAKGPFGRSARIPTAAKDLGDGHSAFKPVGNGRVAFVFDNGSGSLVGRCTAVAPITPTSGLTAANIGPCDTRSGKLLSGVVRFSSASPPDAAQANEAPPSLSIAMAMTGGTYAAAPACSTEPITSANGDRFVAWYCAVYPLASGQWSGRASLVPVGWTIGTSAADKRVCRYSADLDGSGAVDANIEHPAAWVGVDASLPNQNFLVIKGSEHCPTGRAARVAGNNGDVYVDLGTTQHQP